MVTCSSRGTRFIQCCQYSLLGSQSHLHSTLYNHTQKDILEPFDLRNEICQNHCLLWAKKSAGWWNPLVSTILGSCGGKAKQNACYILQKPYNVLCDRINVWSLYTYELFVLCAQENQTYVYRGLCAQILRFMRSTTVTVTLWRVLEIKSNYYAD